MSSAVALLASLRLRRIIPESVLVIIFIVVVTAGCKKETIPSFSNSYDYFPVKTGKWIEYAVDSIYHSESDNNNDDSVYYYHFLVREEIESSFTDGEGRVNQIIKKFKRRDSTEAWIISDVWTQVLISTGAYRTENNICFHKLSFPINSRISWNGNDHNTLEEEIFSYDYFHQPATFNEMFFDSVLSVIQVNEDNFIERFYGNEVYANGIGLVYRQRDELGKRNGIVVSGMEYKMEVTGYGEE